MCDELFYFHGFQWINHIYENGYVYQDRPTYLVIGFIIYRVFFLISLQTSLDKMISPSKPASSKCCLILISEIGFK